MSNMARKKKEEDKKVKTLREAVVELPQRKKVSLAVFVSISVTTLIFLFIFTLIDVVKPALITEEEYLALLPRLDDVDWAIRKGVRRGLPLNSNLLNRIEQGQRRTDVSFFSSWKKKDTNTSSASVTGRIESWGLSAQHHIPSTTLRERETAIRC